MAGDEILKPKSQVQGMGSLQIYRVNLREFRRVGRLVLPCFAFQFCLARSRAVKGNAW